MTWREVLLAIQGLRERDRMTESWHRRSTAIIASTNFGGKGVVDKMNKLWPVEKQKRDMTAALKQLERFKELEKRSNNAGN